MTTNLKNQGQLQNIVVMTKTAFLDRKPALAPRLDDKPYVVVIGCRRLAAAKQAGLPGLKYEIRDDWTARQIDEAAISENIHRLDLNPMLLGRELAEMVPEYGSERKLAQALSKQQAWVNHRVALTQLHEDLQKAIEDGTITFTLARECPRLHPDLQPKLATGDLPVEVAKVWLTKLRLPEDEQLARWNAGAPFNIAAPVAEDQQISQPEPQADAPTRTPRAKPAIVIKIAERSPVMLASALREQLTKEEVAELVHELRE